MMIVISKEIGKLIITIIREARKGEFYVGKTVLHGSATKKSQEQLEK